MSKGLPLGQELSEEQLDFFVDNYVLLKSVAAAREALYKAYPKAQEFHLQTFYAWCRMAPAKKRIKALREKSNQGVRHKPLVQRVERISLLTHALSKVLTRLEREDLDEISPRDLATLCGEVRLGLKAIAEESLPYDNDFKDQVMAPINVLLGQLAPEVKEYALTGKKPEKEILPS